MIGVDLNSDLGESFGVYSIGNDEAVIQNVTSVNIACGFHAGDPLIMEKTVRLAMENKVSIGAHPGFPDMLGFGRRNMNLRPEEIKDYVIYQIGALNGFVRAAGGKMRHVKPHGALYNMAAVDYEVARAVAEAVRAFDDSLILVGLANSEMLKAGRDLGLKTASEVFADRAYTKNGTLLSRELPGAVIKNVGAVVERIVRMIKEGVVETIDHEEIKIKAETVCIHGDNPRAVELSRNLRDSLMRTGIRLQRPE